MAIKPVKKATITALRRDRKALYAALQKLGVVHVDERRGDMLDEPGESDRHKYDSAMQELRELEEAIAFLKPYDRAKKNLLGSKGEVRGEELDAYIERRREVTQAVRQVQSLQERINAIKAAQLRLQARFEQILPWAALPMRVEDIGDTRTCVVVAGGVAQQDLHGLMTEAALQDNVHVEVISESKESAQLLATAHLSAGQELQNILTGAGFARMSFEGFTGTPAEILRGLEAETQGLKNDYEAVEAEAAQAATGLEALRMYYDLQMVRCQRSEQMLKAGLTHSTMNLLVWVKPGDVDALQACLDTVAPDIYMEVSDPGEEDDPPVLVENNAVTTGFSSITEMYSTPKRDEIDPTPLLSIFYFLFFGMMVSDAGYGIVMAVVFGAVWLMQRNRTGKLVKLLFFGGLSTIVWGAMYGTWFGAAWFPPLWMDPISDPLTMLIVCFAFGLVQVVVGLFAKLYINIRNGKWLDALMDEVPWLLILFGAVFMIVPALSTVGTVMIIAGFLAVVLFQGRENKTLGGKLAGGLYSAYGVTSYLSDILSYSRLFALGLATGVVGMVVNTIGGMFTEWGVLGQIASILVYVVGHTFNMGINVLGAYVHDARLQFVEFFGKFYEGGGRAFVPYSARTQYHYLAQNSKK